MATFPIKIKQICTDFNIKSKDVLDFYKNLGIEKSTGGSIDSEEFDILVQGLTSKHMIKDLEAYRSGKTKISCKNAKPKAEPKPAPVAQPQPEKKPEAAQPQPEKKPEAQSPSEKAPIVEESLEVPLPKQKEEDGAAELAELAEADKS